MSDSIIKFMKPNPITVPSKMSLKDAIKKMRTCSIGSVLVVDNNQLVGIFTDKDVVKCYSTSGAENLSKPISEFMTKDPIRIQKNESHIAAHALMKRYGIRHLPVYDDTQLIGIISIRDLAHFLEASPMVTPQQDPEVGDLKPKELSGFQMRNIELLTHLYQHDAVNDDIVERIRESEVDYFSLVEKCKYLEQRVNIDDKTGLLKYKGDYLLNILETASRMLSGITESFAVSFVRFDIDDFSVFNNRYGHDVGDEVLVQFAQFLKDNSRPTDYAIRFGGEEFDVILPNTKPEGVASFLRKLFARMDQLKVYVGNEPVKVTVSAGATTLFYNFTNRSINGDMEKTAFERIQVEADNALYESKYLGKNRFSIYAAEKTNEYAQMREKYSQEHKHS